MCNYYNVVAGSKVAPKAAWTYREPSDSFKSIAKYVAVYASKMDEVTVDGEVVVPQPVSVFFFCFVLFLLFFHV